MIFALEKWTASIDGHAIIYLAIVKRVPALAFVSRKTSIKEASINPPGAADETLQKRGP